MTGKKTAEMDRWLEEKIRRCGRRSQTLRADDRADEAVVNAVDARPAEDGRALRRAEIRQVFLPPLHVQRGEVQAAAQELLKFFNPKKS